MNKHTTGAIPKGTALTGKIAGTRVGFTLVEVLTVMGITVALVAILLPVLSLAREKAKKPSVPVI